MRLAGTFISLINVEAEINVEGGQNLQINKCGVWNKHGGWKNYKCGGWAKHVEGGNFTMTFTFVLFLLSALLAKKRKEVNKHCRNSYQNVIATQM